MAVQVSYPGVYIEEFAPGAPIQGVGTSTAGFIGVAERGPINEPVKITTWDQFKATFGGSVPGFYLWYAVRGFFENGGQVCYVVRASNGRYQCMTLNDRVNPVAKSRPVVSLRARQPGALGITATIADDTPVLRDVAVYRPQAKLAAAAAVGATAVQLAADDAITADQVANRFKPGDEVSFSTGLDRRVIASVNGDTVRFLVPLTAALTADVTMRLANTATGTRTVRLRPPAALPPNQLVVGTILTITQDVSDTQSVSDTQIVDSVIGEVLAEGTQGGLGPFSYRVTFRAGLGLQINMNPGGAAVTATSNELDLTVTLGSVNLPYPGLSMDPAHPHYLIDVVNSDPGGLLRAELVEPPPPNPLATSIPRTGAARPLAPAQPGTAEDLSSLSVAHFLDAIDALRPIDDVNFIAIADRPTAAGQSAIAVQQTLIEHCQLLADRFAVLDTLPGADFFTTATSMELQRRSLDSARGYGALYGPWLRVVPDNSGPPILVPPSGHVCGIFARSDNRRGVHKAPANEIVNGALGVERRISLIEQGQLNLLGINIVQVFQDGGRPVLWGARTTATDTNWQYVNIRRLFLYLEKSIQNGIRWAVFEPNNLQLWQKLRRTIGDFLNRAWRDGALFGAKAEEAYYVRIDETLNPFSEQQLGRLHIEIGVRPSYPAEFIIVRIGIWDGGTEVSEG